MTQHQDQPDSREALIADLLATLQAIADDTDPDDPESCRSDDREGCLDIVHGMATAAIAKATTPTDLGSVNSGGQDV